MTRSKKIFAAFAFLFLLFLIAVVYDISTRTTFPGARPSSEESTTSPTRDSVRMDSLLDPE